jgi:hypothetical protein
MLNPSAIVMLIVGCLVFFGGLAYFVRIAMRSGKRWGK